MVKLNRIYTKTGDRGTTGLGNGDRVPKDAARIHALGAVDEANAAIGIARLHVTGEHDTALRRIQNDLFDVGGDLCIPENPNETNRQPLRVTNAQVDRLERELDTLNEALSPLTSFVLPGGSAASAHIHQARTIVRRAERAVVTLQTNEPINSAALMYLNRLSDYLFVLGRTLNDGGLKDVLWVPGLTQQETPGS